MATRLIDVDITDRANGKLPVWNADSNTHVYEDPASSGIPTGTSMPGTPATNDLIFRTDLGLVFFYDGTRWLSLNQYIDGFSHVATDLPISSTQTVFRQGLAAAGVMAIWAETLRVSFFVTGGTALGASHKWVCSLLTRPGGSTIATVNIDSGASDTWRVGSASIGAVVASTEFEMEVVATKTGTPGTLYHLPRLSYRLIGT